MTPRIPPTFVVAPPAAPLNGANERHAEALAEIRQMHADLMQAHEEIGQLKADLNRNDDRISLLVDERHRLRQELNIFRTNLIELATAMSDINLLTGRAAEIMLHTNELIASVDTPKGEPPPPKAVPHHTDLDAAINKLEEHLNDDT